MQPIVSLEARSKDRALHFRLKPEATTIKRGHNDQTGLVASAFRRKIQDARLERSTGGGGLYRCDSGQQRDKCLIALQS